MTTATKNLAFLKSSGGIGRTLQRLILCVGVLGSGVRCAIQQRENFLSQSPSEILESMRLLAGLDGGTRLEDYERILGGHLVLVNSQTSGPLSAQRYVLNGSSDTFGVSPEIRATGVDPHTPKQVTLRMGSISQRACIPESELKSFASADFKISVSGLLPGTPVRGLVFTPREKPDDPNVWVSYRQKPEGICVDSIEMGYLPNSNEWGH